MKKMTTVLMLLIFISCQQKKVDTKAEQEKLMQLSRDWSQAASTGDIDKMLSYWSEDAVLFSSGELAIKGKKGLRDMLEGSMKTPGFRISWEPLNAEISESGDMGYLIEKTEISFTDSDGATQTQKNNAVTIWRKQSDGSWKNVVDISTPDHEPVK